jgi:hypothetical protein
MPKSKREQARELALKMNQALLDADEEITSGVLMWACALLIGTTTAHAGEDEAVILRDMETFPSEVMSAFQSCRNKLSTH